MKLPNMKKPCANCPFRKDANKAWLGRERVEEILAQDSFVCHKTVDYDGMYVDQENFEGRRQCAGHMLLKGSENSFVQMAERLGLDTGLEGRELVFDSEEDCAAHHDFRDL